MNYQINSRGHEGIRPREHYDPHACENYHTDCRAEDRDIIQQKGERTPKNRITKSTDPHCQSRDYAYSGIHQGDGEQIATDLALNFPGNFHGLSLVGKCRQYLDKSFQEAVTRSK